MGDLARLACHWVAVDLGNGGPERRGLECGIWYACPRWLLEEVLSACVLETQLILGALELPTPKSLLLISTRIW